MKLTIRQVTAIKPLPDRERFEGDDGLPEFGVRIKPGSVGAYSPMFLGILSALCAGALWGFVFLVPKLLGNYSSADIALGRCVVFGFVSCLRLLRRAKLVRQILTPSLALQAAGLSCLSFSVYSFILSASVKYSGVAPVSLIIGLLPITIPLASHDKIVKRGFFAFSLAMILGGLLLLNQPILSGMAQSDLSRIDWVIGFGLAVLACAFWTSYAPLNAAVLRRHPNIPSTTWSSFLGISAFITIAPIWLWMNADHLAAATAHLLAWPYMGWMLVIGAGSSWLAIYLWNFACRHLPTALAGQLIVSEVVFSLFYNYIYDWRLPLMHEFVAAVILITGVTVGIQAFRVKET